MSYEPEHQYYASIRNSAYYKLFLCCLMTLVAMYAHRHFPEKKLTLVPASESVAFLYMDEFPGGKSRVEWVDEKALQWRCSVEADGQHYTCGFHVVITGDSDAPGRDFSGYDSVRVHVDYSGSENRLRFYMRNFEPGFSDINQIETAKFNYLSVPIQFVDDSLILHLEEFSVAEWWISQYQVPRELSQPNFKNVVSFGVDLNYPASPGQHDLKLNKVEFIGLWISAERWYFSILLFWIVVIIVAGALNLAALRRSVMIERIRLEKLASQNTVLAEESNRYKQLSMMDHLTGMLNRQGLSDYIEDNFPAGAHRLVSLVVIDIDHFKQVNDTYGHDGGDKVLRAVAEVIKSNIRQADCAGRWGGEEFVVILPENRLEDAHLMAEKLRTKIAGCHYAEFPQLVVTVSIGVGAQCSADAFHHLFQRVDVALYQAKAQGRNRTVIATGE